MKNIGIITFHRSHNYGSVLQSYALQTILRKNLIDYNCEIIDFIPPNSKEMYSIFKKNTSIKNIAKNILALYTYRLKSIRYKEFERFINTRLKLTTKKYFSQSDLQNISNKYDILICGSDQIWNTNCLDFDYSYYLPFAKNVKKISYAPSLGPGAPFKSNEAKERIKEYLKDFYAISVRENEGTRVIQKLTDKKVYTVLDPTLLLEAKDWDHICSDKVINKDYIFFYSIGYKKNDIAIAKQISKKLNIPVVTLFTLGNRIVFSGFEISKNSAPEDFLSLIKNAKLILSSSFHGTVFSIIYRKPFYSIRKANGDEIKDDDRIKTLLQEFNLMDRQIDINSVNSIENPFNIDYSKSEKYIEEARKRSIEYLLNSINGD